MGFFLDDWNVTTKVCCLFNLDNYHLSDCGREKILVRYSQYLIVVRELISFGRDFQRKRSKATVTGPLQEKDTTPVRNGIEYEPFGDPTEHKRAKKIQGMVTVVRVSQKKYSQKRSDGQGRGKSKRKVNDDFHVKPDGNANL